MSHVAIPIGDPRNREGLIGFDPDGGLIAGKAIHPRTAPAAPGPWCELTSGPPRSLGVSAWSVEQWCRPN
jgi:hypothetical protein